MRDHDHAPVCHDRTAMQTTTMVHYRVCTPSCCLPATPRCWHGARLVPPGLAGSGAPLHPGGAAHQAGPVLQPGRDRISNSISDLTAGWLGDPNMCRRPHHRGGTGCAGGVPAARGRGSLPAMGRARGGSRTCPGVAEAGALVPWIARLGGDRGRSARLTRGEAAAGRKLGPREHSCCPRAGHCFSRYVCSHHTRPPAHSSPGATVLARGLDRLNRRALPRVGLAPLSPSLATCQRPCWAALPPWTWRPRS